MKLDPVSEALNMLNKADAAVKNGQLELANHLLQRGILCVLTGLLVGHAQEAADRRSKIQLVGRGH